MLGLFVERLWTDPHTFIYVVVTVVFSVTLHELAHGYAALRLGDLTPKRSGHWTWNPLVHMGGPSVVMLLLFGVAFGAMPVDPSRLRGRWAEAAVAAAGPLMNLLLALIVTAALAGWQLAGGGAAAGVMQENLRQFLFVFAVINVALCMFNLLPVPPFDGAHVLGGLVPAYRRWLQSVRDPRVFLLVLVLVFVGMGQVEGGITAPAAACVNELLAGIYALAGR
ncbi:MAG: site-2 protease family protein [Planctomycetota bacterium]|nr:site-2 protease family protein [Planctomycetota bacterium]MEC8652572.1 site-2 protease family protein [Planctomycetota bacterium]MEC9046612.1 site-2 protease family protein [Planctomycetota bacterium]